MPELVGNLPSQDIAVSSSAKLCDRFRLADPKFHVSRAIDIILGANKFFEIMKSEKYYETVDKIYIFETELGWVVSSGDHASRDGIHLNSFVTSNEEEDLSSALERLWRIDEVSEDETQLTVDEIECEDFYTKTTKRLSSGRFVVKLPFKNTDAKLGDSYGKALKCFHHLEKKMASDQKFAFEYAQFMKEYLNLNHMREIEYPNQTEGYYIPHHGIWQMGLENSKFRTVFNASAVTSSGVSLNDILHTGPNLLRDLDSILLRFRFGRFALTADIEKMYRQISVAPEDTKYQKILWRFSPKSKLRTFELLTVTYGTASAPYLANRTMKELLNHEEKRYPLGAECLRTSMYMDDVMISCGTLNQLIECKRDLEGMLNSGGFRLKKWASNSQEILRGIPIEDMAERTMVDITMESFVKTLGIKWSLNNDLFSIKFPKSLTIKNTKRNLLSDLSQIYDPFGWFSPVTVSLKLLMQETWVKKIQWDDELPESLTNAWLGMRSDYKSLEGIRLPRFIGYGRVEIHGFADSSQKAYAAAVYSRVLKHDGDTVVTLIASKTRLAPLKCITIPRLELCAAHLLAKLIAKLQPHLKALNPQYFLWSDSTVVLAWLSSPPRRWKTFVSNRASEIMQLCPQIQWNHVGTKENPADIASRGALPDELKNSKLWWEGPRWLRDGAKFNHDVNEYQTEEETRSLNTLHIIETFDVFRALINRVSSFRRIVNIIAYVKKFITRSRKLTMETELTADDRLSALDILIRGVQNEAFVEEISNLKQGRMLKRGSTLYKYTPFIDDSGVLRVGGRLQNGPYDLDKKHPVILPRGQLVALMVRQMHLDFYHAGSEMLIAILHRKYFVPSSRKLIKKVVRECTDCRRYNARTFQPPMGPLPSSRISGIKAFLKTGVDFAGPIALRLWRGVGKLTKKGYICIFICLCTKAVHIELAMSLSSEAFVMALKGFLARRGTCHEIWSDNGSNFVGTAKILSEQAKRIRDLDDPELRTFLSDRVIKWRTIPAFTPHFGGLWEAGIKSIKTHLNKTFKNQLMCVEEYITALSQIEAILNSRPLAPASTDPNEASALTPGHFLLTGPPCDIPDTSHVAESLKYSSRFQLIRCLVNGYWKRWKNEFLSTLNKKSKWSQGEGKPVIGEIVLIKRSHDPPQLWRYGRIHSLLSGSDGVSRVVVVKTKDGLHREATRNLIPLGVEDESPTGENVED